MGLLDRFFGKDGTPRGTGGGGSQFQDSEPRDSENSTEMSQRNTPRRELVQVVLRETMRKHGIPSDWIECRILSVMSTRRGTGMHIQLVVKQGDDRLLTYVHAFQESFLMEIERFEPKASDWIFSVAWQFEGRSTPKAMPDPTTWGGKAAPAPEPAAGAPLDMPQRAPVAQAEDDDVEADLQALFAIRDAAMTHDYAPTDRPDFEPTRPGEDMDVPKTAPRL